MYAQNKSSTKRRFVQNTAYLRCFFIKPFTIVSISLPKKRNRFKSESGITIRAAVPAVMKV